jgi:hypothetical protein
VTLDNTVENQSLFSGYMDLIGISRGYVFIGIKSTLRVNPFFDVLAFTKVYECFDHGETLDDAPTKLFESDSGSSLIKQHPRD